MPGGHRIRDLRGGCRGALSDNRPHSARRGRRDGEGGFWMAAPERRPRGHGGADGNVLADNRAVRPRASGIRFPEITVRYRPARPNGSHAVGYDRIALGRSDPGRAKAATQRSSCFMPCSVEAGPMETRTCERAIGWFHVTGDNRCPPARAGDHVRVVSRAWVRRSEANP